MKKYYVEFCIDGTEDSYSMQSKTFDTKKEATEWAKNSFDYIDTDIITVYVMRMECYEDGSYDIFDEKKIF